MGVTRWIRAAIERDPITDQGTYNSSWSDPTLVLDIAENNITPEQNVQAVPSSYFPTSSRQVLGDYALSGNLNTVADTDMFGIFLRAALGNHHETQEGAYIAYQHMFWSLGPRTNGINTIPSLKLEIGEDEKGRRQINGLLVNTLDITFNRGEPGQIVANVIGANEAAVAWGSPPTTLPSDHKYIFTANTMEGHIGIDPQGQGTGHNQVWLGVDTGAPMLEAFSANINNNIPDDWKRHGSRFLANYMVQEQEITGTMTLSFDSYLELRRYFSGGESPGALPASPGDYIDPFPLILVIDLGIPVVTDANNYVFKMYFPKVVYTSYGKSQTKRDRATIEVNFKALIPDANDSDEIYDFDITALSELIEYKITTVPAYETFLVEDDDFFTDTTGDATTRELAAVYCLLFNSHKESDADWYQKSS